MSVVVQNVTRYFGEQKALDDVSFTVSSGEIVGFLGPNGAGKTTMMRIIIGFLPASSGKVLINGVDISDNNRELRKIIGYLPENNPLYPEMYVKEYLDFVASLYKMGKKKRTVINDIINITGLTPEKNKKIGELSKGYRQRVGLAQALIHNPKILILDEATSGLDPNQITEIRALIKEAGKAKTVILSTHIMQEVEAVCSRVIIIDKGIIVADKPIEKIYSLISRPVQIINVEFDKNPDGNELSKIGGVIVVKNTGSNIWQIEASPDTDIRPELFSFAVNRNLTILSLSKKEYNLEEIFRQLTT
ncbi:MAG TPA: gliding motility-associated ABC transporter ATP-binding subunit GldA [Bacteroidales bacterium]|nr:gliding motility-associated ABC transporter ATP-binding subunit GldA [Bacteroidales bacterium]